MKTIILIRHGESLKNTINSCSSIDGKEPLTKFGKNQIQHLAIEIREYLRSNNFNKISLVVANDKRSIDSASYISSLLGIKMLITDELVTFVGRTEEGRFAEDFYNDNVIYGEQVKLYRAGLISGYEVPWSGGSADELEHKLLAFVDKIINSPNDVVIVVSHKSIITCLSVILLKKYEKYPKDYYGYIDIPVGKGIVFKTDCKHLDVTLLNPKEEKKLTRTDVTVHDGIIVFPESACAVCWNKGYLLLVKQERPSGITWELPGGKIEKDEMPINAARRELLEETQVNAGKGKVIFSLDLDLSISFHRTYLIEFSEIITTDNSINSTWISYEELGKMITSGQITHAPTIVAYLNKKTQGGYTDESCI